MKKNLIGIVIIGIVILIANTIGKGASTDGGWLAKGQGWVYFLQLDSGTGSVDYAYQNSGQIYREHGGGIVHNDGTIEVVGMLNGQLKDCSACLYHLTNGTLEIDYTYHPWGGINDISGNMTLSSSDASTYQQDVQALTS